MILRVGLTGGIASGKTTVAALLAERGCVIIDADRVVADLYDPGAAGYNAIRKAYGDSVIGRNGLIDRARLADVGLADAPSAARLNAMIHPLVETEISSRFASLEHAPEDRVVVVEATLLIEAGTLPRYHKIVVVDLDPAKQRARGLERGMAAAEVERRISLQIDRQERLLHADYLIRNDGDLSSLRQQVETLHESLGRDLADLRGQKG
jgi:dephospho-CoA kinase